MATPFPDVPDIKMYLLYLAGGTPGLGISIRIQYDNEEDKMLLQKEEKIGYRENTEKIQLLIYEKDGGDNKVWLEDSNWSFCEKDNIKIRRVKVKISKCLVTIKE